MESKAQVLEYQSVKPLPLGSVVHFEGIGVDRKKRISVGKAGKATNKTNYKKHSPRGPNIGLTQTPNASLQPAAPDTI